MPGFFAWLFGGNRILFWFQTAVFLPFVLAPIASYRGMRLMGATPWQAVGAAFAVAMCVGGSKWGMSSDGTFLVGLYTQGWALAAFPLALGHGAKWIDEGRSLGGAIFWGLFVGLCHPVAGVSVGLALAASEVGRWLSYGFRAFARAVWPDDKQELWVGTIVLRVAFIALLVYLDVRLWLVFLVGIIFLLLELFPAEMSQAMTAATEPYPARARSSRSSACAGSAPRSSSARRRRGRRCSSTTSATAGSRTASAARTAGASPMSGTRSRAICSTKGASASSLTVPLVALFARARFLPRLWAASIGYFLIMMSGPFVEPHMGRDDPFPAIRVLGSMQICLALAAGAGFVLLVSEARKSMVGWRYQLWGREALGAVAGAMVFVMVFAGATFIHNDRIRAAKDFSEFPRADLERVFPVIAAQMQGRQQVRGGATSHWENALPYVYAGREEMLQMGAAALQSSPNYVYRWDVRRGSLGVHLRRAARDAAQRSRGQRAGRHDDLPERALHAEVVRQRARPGRAGARRRHALPPGRWPARDEGIKWLKGDQPMRNEVLAHDGFGGPGPAPHGTVLAYSRQPSPGDEPDITFDATATAPTTFEIKESWNPHWHAWIDDQPADVRRVTPEFLAIDVPAGTHHVALRFDRPLWTWLVWLLWPGLTLLGWSVSRPRREPAPAAVSAPEPAAAA